MNVTPHIRRTFVATAGTLLALTAMSACGSSAADGRAMAVERSADAVSMQAKHDLRDGWENTARDRHDMVLRQWRRDHDLSEAISGCH
jgi:hypothetical protein